MTQKVLYKQQQSFYYYYYYSQSKVQMWVREGCFSDTKVIIYIIKENMSRILYQKIREEFDQSTRQGPQAYSQNKIGFLKRCRCLHGLSNLQSHLNLMILEIASPLDGPWGIKERTLQKANYKIWITANNGHKSLVPEYIPMKWKVCVYAYYFQVQNEKTLYVWVLSEYVHCKYIKLQN